MPDSLLEPVGDMVFIMLCMNDRQLQPVRGISSRTTATSVRRENRTNPSIERAMRRENNRGSPVEQGQQGYWVTSIDLPVRRSKGRSAFLW
jgi:hypothetical protein